ncbi:hypothetical protein HETIRDRAFT_101141 [Heterobasidion irregulare TC 32-1]|uniref:Uncharacterized protein n=1 Tax=Heterobasidion irregulare (strain TC 32-1) TaxID=747525 RepID=W4KGV1_HETIT|nr:uncharacterized protein HETIRDRAFT_101141 [Heterobasidion irregulare TC 32-1]ETW85088.1 hypothetical protein HETIRDRAFT_101141 [Heterobasidion irregulare TC 32-1]
MEEARAGVTIEGARRYLSSQWCAHDMGVRGPGTLEFVGGEMECESWRMWARCVGTKGVDAAEQRGVVGMSWDGKDWEDDEEDIGGVTGVRVCWEHAAERGEATTNSWKRATTILYRQLSSSSSSFQLFLSPLFSLSVMFLYY